MTPHDAEPPHTPAPQATDAGAAGEEDVRLDIALCPNCGEENLPFDNFCAECGRPFSSYATLGPFESIYARGWLYRHAVEKPSRFVLAGLWALFLPNVLFGFAFLAAFMTNGFQTVGLLLPAFYAFLFTIHVAILCQATKNYRTHAQRRDEEQG